MHDAWDNVFNQVTINEVPAEYIDLVFVLFTDGNKKVIDISEHVYQDMNHLINDIREYYQKDVVKLDVKVNDEKIREDVTAQLSLFLSKS